VTVHAARVWIIDAFNDRAFAGNPAGVCLLNGDTWPDQKWMRQVAAELGHETAFARPLPDSADADWALRFQVNANFCIRAMPAGR
jgi:predicted PhzF superfamily epimerase YddE/YHI9